MKTLNRKLIIGTAQFSGNYGIKPSKVSLTELHKMNKILNYNKIFSFDTAPFYKNSSKKLKMLTNAKSRIFSKIKYNNQSSNLNNIIDNLIKQKNDFKIKKFAGLYIHDFEISKKNNFKKLNKIFNLIKESKISYNIGFSIYEVETLKYILNNFDFQILQIPINILNQDFVRYLPKIKKYKINIFARSIFMQGALINTPSKLYSADKKVFDRYRNWLQKNNYDPVTGCLGYINTLKHIDHIIIGISNSDELNKILTTKLKKNESIVKFKSKVKKLTDPRYWNIK